MATEQDHEGEIASTGNHFRKALDVKAQLGEGLHWDADRHQLWMVDIHGRRVIRWALDSSGWEEWAMAQRVGWVLSEPGRSTVLLGLQEGIARWSPGDSSASLQWLVRPFEGRPHMRLNDAKRDAAGRIWFGSMNNDDEGSSDGCLYRFDPDGTLVQMDAGYMVTNGPAISPDGRTLLHTDSGRRTIYAFNLDMRSGELSARRVWKVFSPEEGFPDGMCFDVVGNIWIAHWSGACISCFDPDGSLRMRLPLPATNVSNVCFAGPAMNRLFATTASSQRLPNIVSDGALFEIQYSQ